MKFRLEFTVDIIYFKIGLKNKLKLGEDKMKKFCIIVISILMLIGNILFANGQRIGVGMIIGEPTGISAKIWMENNVSFDAAAAWSVGDYDFFNFHIDYLFHKYDIINYEEGTFPIYFGVGGKVILKDESEVGIRFPLGIEYIFDDLPLDIFIELAPILNVLPGTSFRFDGAIGIRYFFNRGE